LQVSATTKEKQPAMKKPEPRKLTWERTEDETDAISKQEVKDWLAKVKEECQ
jgi:hypothetical protein